MIYEIRSRKGKSIDCRCPLLCQFTTQTNQFVYEWGSQREIPTGATLVTWEFFRTYPALLPSDDPKQRALILKHLIKVAQQHTEPLVFIAHIEATEEGEPSSGDEAGPSELEDQPPRQQVSQLWPQRPYGLLPRLPPPRDYRR